MPKQIRKILFPYALVVLFAYIGFSLPLPILPKMFLDSQTSIAPHLSYQLRMVLLGTVMAAFPFGQFFGSPILGSLSDRYGRKKLVLFSLAGTTTGYFMIAFSLAQHWISGMVIGLIVCGFCEGNVTIAQSVIADVTGLEEHKHRKSVYFGWLNICISLGFIIGPLMGGVLADSSLVPWFTFATPFWMGGVMTLVGIAVIAWLAKETLQKSLVERIVFLPSLTGRLRSPKIKLFYLCNLLLALGYFAYFRFLPVFLERQFKFSPATLSYEMVYTSLSLMLGVVFLIPWLSRRLKPIRVLCLFSFLLALSFVSVVIPTNVYALIFTIPLVGLCLGVVITHGSLLISNAAESHIQGQALGVLTSVQTLAEIVTGVLGSVLAVGIFTLPIYIGAVMVFLCGILLCWHSKRETTC
jgi:DHA1 family tetracycline resistance protein-like MFS transporter